MQLRKDYILDRWVFYASERKKRPVEFKRLEDKSPLDKCFFCSGNESLTPPEIGRVGNDKKWLIRWFDNKFPAVDESESPKIITNDFFTHSSAYGKHEIIVEHSSHEKQLWDIPKMHLFKLIEVYRQRQIELIKAKAINYVLIFKNHGRDAGTSLIHTHTQVVSLNIVPTLVQAEADAVERYRKCPYCEIVKKELKSRRMCFESRYFAVIAPYASRFNFEVWIFPKWHVLGIDGMNNTQIEDFADIFSHVLKSLKRLNCSYNFYMHHSPQGRDLHFHVEFVPRIATWGGFELATDATINSVLPEDAARFYRGELR